MITNEYITIDIYTDGSTKGNGTDNSVGGWAYLYLEGNEKIVTLTKHSEQVFNTTNNQMELTAIIEAAKHIKDSLYINSFKHKHINIITDSAYVYNCYIQKWYVNWQKNGWKNAKKEPVKNKELWEQLIPFFEDKNFTFQKVKGHSGDKYNEMVDSLAQNAAIGNCVNTVELIQLKE